MNIITKNIIANYLGKLWGFVSIFIFVRFYIDLLGIEAYAIINFYTVILGLLVFADGGLTATLTRELARDIPLTQKANLVHTFERLYVVVCLLIVVVIYFSADLIANNFLESKTYSTTQVAHYISLIGIGVGLQLFSTLYDGGLQGLQQQVITNKIRITWSFFKSGVVLIPLYFAPKLEIFFWWQILCNFAVLIVYRKKLLSFISYANPLFSTILLKSVSSYALGMMLIAFISAINIQLDKLVTSKYLPLEIFGFYSVASILSQIPVMVVSPIMIAVYPLLSNYVSTNNTLDINKLFHKYSLIISSIAIPLVICIALYSYSIIDVWTGKSDIAMQTENVVRVLVLGGGFLCLQLVPFYLGLANGYTKINIFLGLISLMVIFPSIIYCIKNFGMIGATIPWFFVNFITFVVMSKIMITKFLPNQFNQWLFGAIIMPIILNSVIAILVEICFSGFDYKFLFILKSVIIGIVSLIGSIGIYRKLYPRII
mgnify:FL=1